MCCCRRPLNGGTDVAQESGGKAVHFPRQARAGGGGGKAAGGKAAVSAEDAACSAEVKAVAKKLKLKPSMLAGPFRHPLQPPRRRCSRPALRARQPPAPTTDERPPPSPALASLPPGLLAAVARPPAPAARPRGAG